VSAARGASPGRRPSRFLRAEYVLPLTILAAAVMLGISEFMTTFEFTPPGGEPLRAQLASDRHTYALLVLAAFTVATMAYALFTGLRSASVATAVFGLAALLLFLVLDLPDAGKLGDLEDPTFGLASAKAEPQTGFWLEAVGSVVLGLASVAFATLSSEQLRTPLGRRGERRREESKPGPDDPPPERRAEKGKERSRA
jgi:amino acid transporter